MKAKVSSYMPPQLIAIPTIMGINEAFFKDEGLH